jgi:hypothetical protein
MTGGQYRVGGSVLDSLRVLVALTAALRRG